MDAYREQILKLLTHLNSELKEKDCLDILPVTQVFKKMGENLEDPEVVGWATIVESKAKALEESLYDDDQDYEQYINKEYEQYHVREEKARKFCIQAFYKDELFKVDMSKYQAVIEENKAVLEQAGVYTRLTKYADNKTALDKVYSKVMSKVRFYYAENEGFELPNTSELEDIVNSEINEIYRLADKHVYAELGKARKG